MPVGGSFVPLHFWVVAALILFVRGGEWVHVISIFGMFVNVTKGCATAHFFPLGRSYHVGIEGGILIVSSHLRGGWCGYIFLFFASGNEEKVLRGYCDKYAISLGYFAGVGSYCY